MSLSLLCQARIRTWQFAILCIQLLNAFASEPLLFPTLLAPFLSRQRLRAPVRYFRFEVLLGFVAAVLEIRQQESDPIAPRVLLQVFSRKVCRCASLFNEWIEPQHSIHLHFGLCCHLAAVHLLDLILLLDRSSFPLRVAIQRYLVGPVRILRVEACPKRCTRVLRDDVEILFILLELCSGHALAHLRNL